MFDCRDYGYKFTGPVIYEYVSWILDEASKRGFTKIYFLARDGYILKIAAELLCKSKNLSIECRYLYCSRMSLRMPTYFFIGDEAYELLFLWGYYISTYTLLKRLELSEDEIKKICREIGIEDEKEVLSVGDYKIVTAKIKANPCYRSLMLEKSRQAYTGTIAYLSQEGLFDDDKVVIADSGWSGSMQRSLRQLLENAGYTGSIYGMYFGMYNAPKEKKDGEYLTYYFDAFTNIKQKVFFENKFFECILSAPHGMTKAYEFKKGRWYPVLKKELNNEILSDPVKQQAEGMLKYINERKHENTMFDKKKSVKLSYKILKRIMSNPTKDEVEAFGNFNFCDDISDGYNIKIVEKDRLDKLKNNMFFYRLINKLLHGKKSKIESPIWSYGVAAYIKYPVKLWYRWNICIYEYIKNKNFSCKEKKRFCK